MAWHGSPAYRFIGATCDVLASIFIIERGTEDSDACRLFTNYTELPID